MAHNQFPIVNIRVPADQLVIVKQLCETNGINVSEYIRGLIAANLEGMPPGTLLLGVDEGYLQARRLAARLAHAMLNESIDLLPDSYEEALVRYGGLNSLGRPIGHHRRKHGDPED